MVAALPISQRFRPSDLTHIHALPSRLLRVPRVGAPASVMGALLAKRSDVSGDIGCLVSAQRKIRHLGMRGEKEESNFLRGEIRLTRDRRERQNVGIGLCLAT